MKAAPLIVGAGPAGMRAACALVEAGLRPVIVDEAPSCGGQIYRQPLVPDGRSAHARYGSEAAKATRLHTGFAALADHVDYHPSTMVWTLADGHAHLLSGQSTRSIAYDGLILATGAMDRVLPLPGWTLPGVFTLGGAQIALKAQGAAIGRKVVFLGSGPLLYLVAWQYMKAGITVAAVLDTAPFAAKFALLSALMAAPRPVLLGARYVAELRLGGVKLHFGVEAPRFVGQDRLTGVEWQQNGQSHVLEIDGAGYGFGLKPETQLADLAGCDFAFSDRDRLHLPVRDAAGRSTVQSVYVAGDGAGIMGADAAECAGERAALALLEDRGLPFDAEKAGRLDTQLARLSRFRDAMEQAFPFPADLELADDIILCRCEEIRVADVRAAIRHFEMRDINRLKAVSRVGMGRCQGRVCAAALAECLARETGQSLADIGRLRGQAPVKPLPLTLLAAEQENAP